MTISVCLLLLLGVAASWREAGNTQDEGLLLEYPMLILHGKVPFRDFQSSYGPGTYLPLAAAYDVFGPSVSVERAAGAGYRLAVVLAIIALTAPLGIAVQTASGALAVVGILGPGPPAAYGWYAALACVLWSIWFGRRELQKRREGRRSWPSAVSGALAGLAISIRPDFAIAACIAAFVPLAWGTHRVRVAFVCGLAIGLIPLGINVLLAGFSSLWTYGVRARLHTLGEQGQTLAGREATFAAALVGAVVVLLITAVRERRRHGPEATTRCWLALSALSVILLVQAFQRPDSAHFAFVAPLILGLLPWAADALVKIGPKAGTAIPFVCSVAVLFHSGVGQSRSYPLENAGRSFPASFEQHRDLNPILRWVGRNVSPGAAIFVGPEDLRWALWDDTVLYFLTPTLRPSNFYLELFPGDNTVEFTNRFVRGLTRSDVLILQRITASARHSVYPYARPGSDVPSEVVRRDFRVVFRLGAYSVWLRKRR